MEEKNAKPKEKSVIYQITSASGLSVSQEAAPEQVTAPVLLYLDVLFPGAFLGY